MDRESVLWLWCLVGGLSALDEALLRLRGAVELPKLFHTLHDVEVLGVETRQLLNAALDSIEHDTADCHLAKSKGVSSVDVSGEDCEVHELAEDSTKDVVKFVA